MARTLLSNQHVGQLSLSINHAFKLREEKKSAETISCFLFLLCAEFSEQKNLEPGTGTGTFECLTAVQPAPVGLLFPGNCLPGRSVGVRRGVKG